MTKGDLRCFVALAGMLPAKRYVPTCRSNSVVCPWELLPTKTCYIDCIAVNGFHPEQ